MHRVVLRSRRLRPTPPHIALRAPVLAVDASTWHLFKQGALESQFSCGPHIIANAFGSSYDTVLGYVFVRNLEASKAQSPPTDTGGAAACTSQDRMEESQTAATDPDEARVSEYPTCPQTDGHLLVTEKEGGNCLNASIRNSTDDVNEVANVATPKPARPVEEQFSKLNALPDDDGPTRALSGAGPCKPSTAALPPQVVKQNSAGVADPATNKLDHRQESLAVIKYVPAPAYSSLFTARNAKEADRFRENGGDVASITTWQPSDDHIHGQNTITLPLTLLGKESEGGIAAGVGSDRDSSASSEDSFAACEALSASSLTPGTSSCTSEEGHGAPDAGEIIGTLVASDDTFAQPNGPSGHNNAGAGKSDITSSKMATASVKSGGSVELEVVTPSPSAATCNVGRAPCSELPQCADASICQTSVLSEPSNSSCSDKIEKSTGDVDGVPTTSDAVTSKAGGNTEGGEAQGTFNGAQAAAGKDATPPNGSALTVILVSAKPKEVKKADYSFLDLAVRNFEGGRLTSCEGTGQSKRKAKFSLFRARYLLQHESEPSKEVSKPVSVVGTPSGRARVPREYCTPPMQHRSMLKEAWCKRTLRRANPHIPAVPSSLAQPTEPGQPGLLSTMDKGRAPCASDTFYRPPKRSLPGELWNKAIANWKGVGPEERAKAFASRALARASAPVSASEPAPGPEPEPAVACPLQSRIRSPASLVLSRAETSSPPHSVMSSPTSPPSRLPVPGRDAVSSIPRLAQASPPSPLNLHSSGGASSAAAASASQSQKASEKENIAPAPADSMRRPTVVRSRLPVHSVVRSLQPTQPVVGKSWADGHATLANPQGTTVEKRAALSPVVNVLAKRRAASESHSLIPVACVSSIPRRVPSSTHLRETTVVAEPSPNSARLPTSVFRGAPHVALAADGQMATATSDK